MTFTRCGRSRKPLKGITIRHRVVGERSLGALFAPIQSVRKKPSGKKGDTTLPEVARRLARDSARSLAYQENKMIDHTPLKDRVMPSRK